MGTFRTSTILTVLGTVALLPIAMLPILAKVTRRYGGLRGWPMLTAVGLLGSAVALAAYTVFPLPDPGTLECTGEPLRASWQTDLFASFEALRGVLADVGFPAVLTTATFLQLLLNVVLFVPYGFFLHQVTRWPGFVVTAVGLGTSALIELTQGTGVFRLYPCPYRVFDVDDLVTNTLGTAVGVTISYAVLRFAWARPAPSPDLEPPTVTRRVVAAVIDAALVLVAWAGITLAWLTWLKLDSRQVPVAELAEQLPRSDVLLAASIALLTVVVPLLRRDRATLGQVIVNVAPVRGERRLRRAGLASVLARAVVRWGPWVVFGPPGLAAVAVVEVVVAAARRDRRSLAGLCGGTVTCTRPALDAVVIEYAIARDGTDDDVEPPA